jgi:hypothetical protein
MRYQIHLHKTRTSLIPLLKGAHRNPLFEPGASPRGGGTPPAAFSALLQETVCGGRAHRQQLAAAGLTQQQMVRPFQCFDQGGQEGHQPLGTNTIGPMPELRQDSLHLGSIRGLTSALVRAGLLWRMVEQPDRRAACIACNLHHLVKHLPFGGSRCLLIARCHPLNHFPLGLRTQLPSHLMCLFSPKELPNCRAWLASFPMCLSFWDEDGSLK